MELRRTTCPTCGRVVNDPTNCPYDLWDAAKARAAELDTTVSAVIREALRAFVAR